MRQAAASVSHGASTGRTRTKQHHVARSRFHNTLFQRTDYPYPYTPTAGEVPALTPITSGGHGQPGALLAWAGSALGQRGGYFPATGYTLHSSPDGSSEFFLQNGNHTHTHTHTHTQAPSSA